MNRFTFLVIVLLVMSLAPERSRAQANDGRAEPGQKTVVKIGAAGRPDQAALELALRRGYFDRQGITLDIVGGDSGQQFVPSLSLNQIQVTSGSPNAGLFNALNRGIDIRLVADYSHVSNDAADATIAIMVRADLIDSGAVKTAVDLRGRTVAAGPSKGQVSDVVFDKLFRQVNMSAADVTMAYLGFSESLAGLSSKKIDAAYMIEPTVTSAQRQNIARPLISAGKIYPGGELSIVMYSSEFAAQTELATRFMVAYLEGVRDYHDAFVLKKNRDAAIAILTQHLPIKDPKIWEDISPQTIDLNGRINVADLKSQAAFYQRQGTLSGPIPDIDKQIDTRFAAAAVKRIGVR